VLTVASVTAQAAPTAAELCLKHFSRELFEKNLIKAGTRVLIEVDVTRPRLRVV
jgi:hypothetical protein